MVSAKTEAALHPRLDDDGADQHEAAAAAAMGHSLTASRNLMAALKPLEAVPDMSEYPDDHSAGGDTAFRDAGSDGTAPAAIDVGLQFRLYRQTSGNRALLQRVDLPQGTLDKAFAAGKEGEWQRVLSPAHSVLEKDLVLASLLEQPLQAPHAPDSQPVEQADLIPQLSGVLMMQPLARTATNAAYCAAASGDAASEAYRVQLQTKDGQAVSAWHDVPLHNAEDGTLNFICEIPKHTTAKMEVATGEGDTPIKQDIKKGKLRHYHEGIPWNYGMLPQTWEDPDHVNNDCGGVKGDDDPVDVIEIGSKVLKTGGVYHIKALGAYAMIDEGELDWKVIGIRTDDPLASRLSDVADIDRELPGELERIMAWFRDYKIPDGKPPNAYGYDAKALDAAFAKNVVAQTSAFYQQLRAGTKLAAREDVT